VLLLLAQGTHRQPFFDLAIVSAVLSFAGGLAFARFLERWV
jgi:multisubunit Na+/H+ antiporter MnhF subunit